MASLHRAARIGGLLQPKSGYLITEQILQMMLGLPFSAQHETDDGHSIAANYYE